MRDRTLLRGLAITVGVFLVMLALLAFGLSQVSVRSDRDQVSALRDAVMRATLTCYAVEGRYPPDTAYLQAHYGLVFDHQQFIVSIKPFADNILPDISILTEGEV